MKRHELSYSDGRDNQGQPIRILKCSCGVAASILITTRTQEAALWLARKGKAHVDEAEGHERKMVLN